MGPEYFCRGLFLENPIIFCELLDVLVGNYYLRKNSRGKSFINLMSKMNLQWF